MDKDILELIARAIGWFEPLHEDGPGHCHGERKVWVSLDELEQTD